MKYFKIIMSGIFLAPICALVFLNIMFCGTDVVYISSDGKWSERQMIYRNREFKDIVSSFEKYKAKCSAPDVKLERLRSRPEWIVFSYWVDNPTDVKAQVPLSSNFLEVTFGFATPTIESAACYKNV